MLDVFYTVDVEVWCDGWKELDKRFPNAFRQYIYGPTANGYYGLPYQLKVLNEHGLKGVFFVEALFSTRFGLNPLTEIIGLLKESVQEIGLHLHTEWVNESLVALLNGTMGKKQHLRNFSLEEQKSLIAIGAKLVRDAGGGAVAAFRAGNMGFNRDTLRALSANRIPFDSSYSARRFGPDSGVMNGIKVVEPIECDGICEYPLTVFDDGTGHLRNAQLSACTHSEIEGLLWKAFDERRRSFVILSHSFELLNQGRNRSDPVVVNRFRKLCSFLDRNRDCFRTQGFLGLQPQIAQQQPLPLTSPIWRTGARMLQQAYRRIYQ